MAVKAAFFAFINFLANNVDEELCQNTKNYFESINNLHTYSSEPAIASRLARLAQVYPAEQALVFEGSFDGNIEESLRKFITNLTPNKSITTLSSDGFNPVLVLDAFHQRDCALIDYDNHKYANFPWNFTLPPKSPYIPSLDEMRKYFSTPTIDRNHSIPVPKDLTPADISNSTRLLYYKDVSFRLPLSAASFDLGFKFLPKWTKLERSFLIKYLQKSTKPLKRLLLPRFMSVRLKLIHKGLNIYLEGVSSLMLKSMRLYFDHLQKIMTNPISVEDFEAIKGKLCDSLKDTHRIFASSKIQQLVKDVFYTGSRINIGNSCSLITKAHIDAFNIHTFQHIFIHLVVSGNIDEEETVNILREARKIIPATKPLSSPTKPMPLTLSNESLSILLSQDELYRSASKTIILYHLGETIEDNVFGHLVAELMRRTFFNEFSKENECYHDLERPRPYLIYTKTVLIFQLSSDTSSSALCFEKFDAFMQKFLLHIHTLTESEYRSYCTILKNSRFMPPESIYDQHDNILNGIQANNPNFGSNIVKARIADNLTVSAFKEQLFKRFSTGSARIHIHFNKKFTMADAKQRLLRRVAVKEDKCIYYSIEEYRINHLSKA